MPDTFCVNFAKLKIEINCLFDFTRGFCGAYVLPPDHPAACDFSVSVSEEAIQKEIDSSPYHPRAPYAESICAYREIAEKLPLYDRCVFHGAVISYDGKGYIFTAPSGTGKTTHIRLWQQYLSGVEIVNGDKPILHIEEDGVTAYATPYAGKEGYENHTSVPLSGICIVEQAPQNSLRRMAPAECLMRIIMQMYKPYNTAAAVKTLELLDRLLSQIPVYVLGCNISEDAVRCSFEGMTGLSYDERKQSDEN